jgi:hypothetical protein
VASTIDFVRKPFDLETSKRRSHFTSPPLLESTMGYQKELLIRMEELREVAIDIAKEAGAVEECVAHPDILLDQYDDDALTPAYKIANKRISAGDIDLPDDMSRKDFTDLIKEVVSESRADCPRCERIMRE